VNIIKTKVIILLIMLAILLCITSCSTETEIKQSNEFTEEEKSEDTQPPIEKKIIKENYEFNTIENTYTSLNKIGGRLIGTDANYLFAKELKNYMNKNFKEAELISQPYKINLTKNYIVNISSDGDSITFNDQNSICKYINKSKLSEKDLIVTNSLESIKKVSNYIFFTEDESLIEESKNYNNICISFLVVDEIFIGQNAIKIKTEIPTIMNIDIDTSKRLAELVNKSVELNINITNEELELENIFAVVKGKESSNAVVITSHYDSTTAKGSNYSKGAIDNGSGVSLNLLLLKKIYNNANNYNYDVIFAFVNSEEGFLLKSTSGSMQLNNYLSEKYEKVLNVNLDCLGEKNIEVLNYGMDGNLNVSELDNIILAETKGIFSIEKVDYYTSDNISFENSIYFYNFDYHGENRSIHTERDNLAIVDIDMLEKLSNILYEILVQILNTDVSLIFK